MTAAKRNRVTLADVAKAANVSRSTASRALNNSPRISRETTARIKKIADSVGFIPNAQGRALAVGRNETIAILITEPLDELFDDPTYAMFISGITEKLSESSYLPVLLQASTDFDVIVCNNIWNDAHSTRLSTFPPTPTTICWRKCTNCVSLA